MALSGSEQTLFNTLPATGEIDFDAWRKQLIQSDQVDLLDANYHRMRRAKSITVQLRPDANGVLTSYVSRPAAPASNG